MIERAQSGAVILAGGRSNRMGSAKSHLDWHGSTFLYRTAAVLTRVVDGPVVVVHAPGQNLPELPSGVRTTVDLVPGRGPLAGIATGLMELVGHAEVAFVCATDLPLLHPAFVRTVLSHTAPQYDMVLPVALEHAQHLAAAYRVRMAKHATTLLESEGGRLGALVDSVRTRHLSEVDLLADPAIRAYDPQLMSLFNVNRPQDYAQAVTVTPPSITIVLDGESSRYGGATLGHVAAHVNCEVTDFAEIEVNGVRLHDTDHRFPLVAGDVVVLTTKIR